LLVRHDIRGSLPVSSLPLILCRNLVYTYFDRDLQRAITQRLAAALAPGGILVVGSHEALPGDAPGFVPLSAGRGIYQRIGDPVT
jgi:chemotaxis protein methyltransferase CheR